MVCDVISSELDLFVPYILNYAFAFCIMKKNMYFLPSTQNLEVVEGQFLKTNVKEHCFLAPAKLPRSAILNDFVNKIITAIQKSLKLLF